MKLLESNITLLELNLSANLLEDQFATALAHCLTKNEILEIVDIGRNNIGPEGGK